MSRSTWLIPASIALLAAVACWKSSNDSAAASPAGESSSAGASHPSFIARGAGACDKYITNDVFKRIVGADPDERKVLSGQSCTVRSTKTDGGLTITLKSYTPQSFHAYREFLSDPQPLPGVGDSALTSIAPSVTAMKGNMGCDFDAQRGTSATALSGAERAKALGEICNSIFTDAQ